MKIKGIREEKKKKYELQNSTSDSLSEDKFNSSDKKRHNIYIYTCTQQFKTPKHLYTISLYNKRGQDKHSEHAMLMHFHTVASAREVCYISYQPFVYSLRDTLQVQASDLGSSVNTYGCLSKYNSYEFL